MLSARIYLLILFFGSTFQAWSQTGTVLTAERDGRLAYLPDKMPVRVVVKQDSSHSLTVMRGYLHSNVNGTVSVLPFHRSTAEENLVNPPDIQRLKPLSRRTRKVMLIALGGAAVYSGIVYLAQRKNNTVNGYAWIPHLPSMAVGFVFVYGFPLTYGFDWIREKKAKKGWRFSQRKY